MGILFPHRDLIPEFVEKGLPRERLFPWASLCRRIYTAIRSQKQARHSLDLPEEEALSDDEQRHGIRQSRRPFGPSAAALSARRAYPLFWAATMSG